MNNWWGQKTPFLKVLIIRGIGYRAFFVPNELCEDGLTSTPYDDIYIFIYTFNFDEIMKCSDDKLLNFVSIHEVTYPGYLMLRAGHSLDLYIPMQAKVRSIKKNRKLMLSASSKEYLNDLAKKAWFYRKPSVYTGRGVRLKGFKVVRKAGKKDKQKGRNF